MHTGGTWDTPNTGSEPGKARWSAKSFPGCPVAKTRVFTAMGPGSIPGQTTKIPQAKQWGQKKKRQQKRVPMETQKKYPIKVTWTATRAWLSLLAHPCVYAHVPFFLLINTSLVSLLSVPMWKFISAQLTGQDLVTGLWSPVGWWLGFSAPTAPAWLQSLARNWNPSSSHCRPNALEMMMWSV